MDSVSFTTKVLIWWMPRNTVLSDENCYMCVVWSLRLISFSSIEFIFWRNSIYFDILLSDVDLSLFRNFSCSLFSLPLILVLVSSIIFLIIHSSLSISIVANLRLLMHCVKLSRVLLRSVNAVEHVAFVEAMFIDKTSEHTLWFKGTRTIQSTLSCVLQYQSNFSSWCSHTSEI